MNEAARSGVFVAVVGPSGAGKDSIMRGAAILFAGDKTVHFARRVVTRISGADEDHDSVSLDEFSALVETGGLALYWQANGLHYGIPAMVREQLADGNIVIANASRAITPQIKATFQRCLILHITASDQVLSNRLASRGREAMHDQQWRLARSKTLEQEFDADVRIENNGEIEDAVDQFLLVIKSLKSRKNV